MCVLTSSDFTTESVVDMANYPKIQLSGKDKYLFLIHEGILTNEEITKFCLINSLLVRNASQDMIVKKIIAIDMNCAIAEVEERHISFRFITMRQFFYNHRFVHF